MSNTTWVGGSSDLWEDVLNWSGGILPTSSASFASSSATVTVNNPFSGDIVKTGLNKLVINGNLYGLTGNLTLQEGIVELNKTSPINESNLNISFAPISSQVSSYDYSILQTYGNLTLGGIISANTAITDSTLVAVSGDLNINNKLTILNSSRSLRIGKFGPGANDSVRYNLNGELAGSGIITKYSAGTLVYNPSNTSNFSGYISINGGHLKLVNTNLGARSPSLSFLQFNSSGTIEVRKGSANITSGGGLAAVYIGSSFTPIRIFGGSAEKDFSINGSVNFGNLTTLTTSSSLLLTINSRDGYGVSFNNIYPFTSSTFTLDAQTSGPLTINGSLGSTASGIIVSRSSEGKVIVNGTNAIKTLTLNGNGTFILSGASIIPSFVSSSFTVNANKLHISNFLSLAANTTITISTGTSSGALIINGSGTSPVGLQKTEAIRMNGSFGYIYANQPVGAILLSGGIAQYYGSSPSTSLRGSNKEDNTILGISNINTVTNHGLRKDGLGTWVLDAFANITSITSELGTLKIKGSIVLPSTVSVFMGSSTSNYAPEDANATNTLEFVSTPTSNNSFYLSTLASNVGDTTIKLSPNSGNTVNVSASASTSGAATLNIIGADSTSNTFISRGSSGYQGPYRYFNGTDVVFSSSGVYRAPIYGSDAGFSAADTITANTHIQVSPGVSLMTSTEPGLSSLKLGGTDQNTGANATLTLAQDSVLLSNLIIASGGTSYINGINAKFSNSTVIIRANDLSDKLVFNSDLEATATLIKSGLGTLELAGANNSIGALTINGGKVKLTGSAYLRPNPIYVGAVALRAGTVLDLGSSDSNTSYISSVSGTGNIVNSTSLNKTVYISSASTGFQGAIHDTGVGNLSVDVNTINFNRLNTYSGDTKIRGTVSVNYLTDLGQPSSLGKGNIVFNGGTLLYSGAVYEGQSFPILSYQSATTNRIPVLGENSYSVYISSNAQEYNSIMWTNPAEISHTFVSDKTIFFRGLSVGKNTFNCAITDSGLAPNTTSVRKENFGVWSLSGNNTYSGSTVISGGILCADPETNIPNNSQLDIVSGTLHGNGQLIREIGGNSGKMSLGTMPYGHAGFSAGSKGLIVYWSGQPVWGDIASGFLNSRSGLILNGGHTNDASFGFFTPSIAEGCLDIKGSLSLGSAIAVSKTVTASASGAITAQVGSVNSTKYQINLTGGATTEDLAAGHVVSNATSNTIITNIFSATAFETSTPISGAITITGLPCRPIRVDDNIYSGEDYAIMSGHITGEAGLLKWGSGRLELPYFNSYSGPTHLQSGTIAVNSLGSSEFNGLSSLGLNLNADTDSSAVYMGVSNAVSYSSSATLAYKGPGETSNRKILLYGHGTFSIDADGTGPLVLTNLVNSQNVSSNSSKTLQLRGSNIERNRITSNLMDTSNLFNGKLAVNIASSRWSLEGNSTYSGNTLLFTGAYLGLGSNSCIGLSTLSCTNGSCTLEAINGSRTLNNPLLTSSITYFVGDNSLKFNAPMTVSNTSTSTITNTISSSSNLIIGGMLSYYEANSSIVFNGSGNTRIEGAIVRSNETYKWSVTKADSGNLVFVGATTAISSITVSAGNLIFESANATTYGNLTLATGGVNFKGAKVNIKGNFTLNGGSIRLGS